MINTNVLKSGYGQIIKATGRESKTFETEPENQNNWRCHLNIRTKNFENIGRQKKEKARQSKPRPSLTLRWIQCHRIFQRNMFLLRHERQHHKGTY